MKKPLSFYSNLFAWGLLAFLLASYIFGWTTPSTNPPSSNLPSPINTGSQNQAKVGYLAVGTSTTPQYPLEVGNQLRVWGQIISKVASGTAPFVIDSPTVITNLNADKLDGYDAADLLASSGGDTYLMAGTYFTTGGNPYFCKQKVVSNSGLVTTSNINENYVCDTNKICSNGECVTSGGVYCDDDGDGHTSSYLVANCTNKKYTPGDDCDDACGTCYPGSTAYTTSPDGKDQDCDGQIDEILEVICTPSYSSSYYTYGYNAGCVWAKNATYWACGLNFSPPSDTTHCIRNGVTCTSYSGGWGYCYTTSMSPCKTFGGGITCNSISFASTCDSESTGTTYYALCKEMVGCATQVRYQ